jgi:hypothetical protein
MARRLLSAGVDVLSWFKHLDREGYMGRSIGLTILGPLLLSTLSGCAETKFKVVNASHGTPVDKNTNGIRYYAPTTYILIKPDYKNGKAELIVFNAPDTTTTYAADPQAWMASHNTELSFQNGMLTKVLSHPNSTKVAVDTVNALSAIASKGLEAAAAAAKAASMRDRPEDAEPTIYLFRLESNGTLASIPLRWN